MTESKSFNITRTGTRQHRIAVIDGPNMSYLGKRNKRMYGEIDSLDSLKQYVANFGNQLGVETESFSSNFEGAILEYIHEAAARVDAFVINPAGLTTTGQAVRQILQEIGKPVAEVHFANISASASSARGASVGPGESLFTPTATGLCMGFRQYSYLAAILAVTFSLDDQEFQASLRL